MKVDTAYAAKFLKQSDNILILTHKSPDGDTLGSACALCRALLADGKRAVIRNSEEYPEKYKFLFEGIPTLSFTPEVIVAVDIADTKLLGDPLSAYADRVDLCIDHHPSNTEYAKALLLNAGDGAAALTVYRVLKAMGTEITPAIATNLYTGLSTDTGCFRYSNASPEAYRVAADLIDAGADSTDINVRMFETKPLSYFRLLSRVLDELTMYDNGQISVLKVTQKMLQETGATEDQCDAIAAMSRQIAGVKAGITMKQKKDGTYKFSLRTHAPLDASKACLLLGGGGHARAAGCDAGLNEQAALKTILDYLEHQLAEEQPAEEQS